MDKQYFDMKWRKKAIILLVITLLVGIIFKFEYAFATVALGSIAILFIELMNNLYMKGKKKWARSLGFLAGLGLTVFVLLFIYLQTTIHRGLPYELVRDDYQYIIVLGGGTEDGVVKEGLRNRLDKTLEIYNDFPDAVYVLTGGVGPGEEVSEASAMKAYLVDNGMTDAAFILEEKSLSTADNFDFCQTILDELGVMDQKMLVITSEYHMNRALYLAYDRGYQVDGLVASTRLIRLVESTTREFYATIKTYLVD